MAYADTVKKIYEAFGRADVPAILDQLADDVEWEYGINSTEVPWLQPLKGREHVSEFFQALGGLTIKGFRPKTFLEAGQIVVVLIDLDATVKATGRPVVEEDEVHIWYFNSAGMVARFRHRVDTHQQWLAHTGN